MLIEWALRALRNRGLVESGYGRYRLTNAGRQAAAELIRSHRLWETYLDSHLDLPVDHLHAPAERLEHLTDASLRDRLAAASDVAAACRSIISD